MASSERRTLSITAKLNDLFTRPLGKSQAAFLAFSRNVGAATKSILDRVFNLKTAVLALATSFVSLSTIKAFGEQADALIKLSNSTGDTIGNLSELQAAFDLAGVKAEGFDTVLRSLLTQARKAQEDGGDKLAESFAALGVSLGDLQRLGPAQLFERLAAGLETYRTAQEKAVALGKVLPEQFLDLLPILGSGLQKFQAAIREARESGATVTASQAAVAERLNDSLSKVQLAVGGISRSLIEQFGPAAITLFENIAKGITNNREGIVEFANIVGKAVVTAFGLATDAVIGFASLIDKLVPKFVLNEELFAQAARLRQQIADNTTGFASLSPDAPAAVRKLREELERVEEVLDKGIAGQLRRVRAELNKSFDEVTASLTQPKQQPNTDEAAAMFGLPAIKTWEDYARAMQAAMNPGAANVLPAPGSVFESPTGSALPDTTAFESGMDRAADSAEKVRTSLRDAMPERGAFSGNFWDGFNAGADEAIVSLTDFSAAGQAAAQQLLVGGFNGLSDAFAEVIMGTKSAKEAFRDFAVSVLADLSRIIARQLILNAVSAAFGGGGGIGGAIGSSLAGATASSAGGGLAIRGGGGGGLKSIGGSALAPSLRSTPTMAMGGGGATNLTFNVSAVDGKDVQRMLIDQRQTITAIWQNEVKSVTGSRNLIKAAAR